MEKAFIAVALVLFIGGLIYLRTHKVKKVNGVNGGGGSADPKPGNNENQTT